MIPFLKPLPLKISLPQKIRKHFEMEVLDTIKAYITENVLVKTFLSLLFPMHFSPQ